jgi:glycosyltransferase involved in cell wall biosynthesis
MEKLKFTIIIPTRERADTLLYSLKTCTDQNYENLQIIVSDNYSGDNTREVVESFKDSRIKYINTGKRISMSHNWEFAMDQVTDGLVCFLGDDDGFLCDAVAQINTVLNDTGLTTITWLAERYIWPSWTNNNRANFLSVTLNKGFDILDCKKQKEKILKCETGYAELPWLYKGFASLEDINKVKKITGAFFHSMIPDVYSGVALMNVIDKYIFSHKPYAFDANSGNSNSGLYKNDEKKIKENIPFLTEENIPYNEKLIICLSGAIMLAESIYQAADTGILKLEQDIDLLTFCKVAIGEVKNSSAERYETLVNIVKQIAQKNNLDMEQLFEFIKSNPNRPFKEKFDYNVSGFNYLKNRIDIDALKYNVSNVYEAAVLHNKILTDPSEYFAFPNALKSNFNFLGREFKKRFL